MEGKVSITGSHRHLTPPLKPSFTNELNVTKTVVLAKRNSVTANSSNFGQKFLRRFRDHHLSLFHYTTSLHKAFGSLN